MLFNIKVTAQSRYTSIYNEKVEHVDLVERPISSSDGKRNIPLVPHQGVR